MTLSLLQPTRTESLSENNDSSHDTRRPIKSTLQFTYLILNIIFKNWIFKIRAWISNNKKLFSNIENSYNFFLVSNILEIHLQNFFSSIKNFQFLSTMVWYFWKYLWFQDKSAFNLVEKCKSCRFTRNSVLEYVLINAVIAGSKKRAKMYNIYKA